MLSLHKELNFFNCPHVHILIINQLNENGNKLSFSTSQHILCETSYM